MIKLQRAAGVLGNISILRPHISYCIMVLAEKRHNASDDTALEIALPMQLSPKPHE
jgi:hypothetical protein